MKPRRLYRCRRDRQLAGVAAGMAEYFDLDPTVVRILWILSAFVGGFTILLYIILAFVVPLAPAPRGACRQPRVPALSRPARSPAAPRIPAQVRRPTAGPPTSSGTRRFPTSGLTAGAADGEASTSASCSSSSARSPWPTR